MTTSAPSGAEPHLGVDDDHMHCMEVWGGNGSTKNHFQRPGLDLWIWSQAKGCAESGGSDLHLLSSCASGRITRTLLADVCGYGTLFAEVAAELRELMARNVNSIRQARLVREMNHRLEHASRRGGFASTLLSTYFAPSRSFTLCNAGHPPPLLFRAHRRQWSVLKQSRTSLSPDKVPLGVVDPREYQHFQTRLDVGDMVLNYSNPFTECRAAAGGVLGIDGLLSRVRQLDPYQPSDLAATLATQLKHEQATNLAAADATLLLCRATERGVAWRDNVLAPFRLLRTVSDKTTLV